MRTWNEYAFEAVKTADMGKGRTIEGFTFTCGLVGEAGEYKEALIKMFGSRGQTLDREFGAEPTKEVDGKLLDAVKKELGDFLWYTAALWVWSGWCGTEPLGCTDLEHLQRTLGQTTRNLNNLRNFRSACLDAAAPVAELTKKYLGHGKQVDPKVYKDLLENCIVAAFDSAAIVGIDACEVMDLNIAKLRARFAGGGWNATLAGQKREENPVKTEVLPPMGTHAPSPGAVIRAGLVATERVEADALKARTTPERKPQVPYPD